MIRDQIHLLQLLTLKSKNLKKFCALSNIDEMYTFSKKLVPSLSEQDFYEFILKSIFIKKEKEKMKKLSHEDALNVLGGKNILNPKFFVSFVSFMFINFSNGFVSAQVDSAPLSSQQENFYTASSKYDYLKNWISDNKSHVKSTLVSVGKYAAVATAFVASGFVYKNSDNFFQRYLIGNTNSLRADYNTKNLGNDINVEQITINNRLNGFIYRGSNGEGELHNKYVIFYSGSGSSNTSQIRNIIRWYVERGASVVGVDYGGFGSSGKQVSSGKIRQNDIYSDAQEIYNYVKKTLNIRKSDIIIHGYSLGGAVAAHVAANVSDGEDRLCGLILQSSIKNTRNAAYEYLKDRNIATRFLGTLGGYLFADQFNCEKELRRLFKKSPTTPISICGGNPSSDHLSLAQTNLDNLVREIGFENIKVYSGSKGHMDADGAPVENFVIPNNL